MTRPDDESIYVLHVDDDPELGALTAEFLRQEDDRLKIYTVTNPDEGLAVLQQWDIDCVVSDYEMDGRERHEFRRTVHTEHPALPLILYTPLRRGEIEEPGISEGAAAYLRRVGRAEQYATLAKRIGAAVDRQRTEPPVPNRQ